MDYMVLAHMSSPIRSLLYRFSSVVPFFSQSYGTSLNTQFLTYYPDYIFLGRSYWAIGLHSGAVPFFRFLLFLFLGVYIAEAQSVLVAAVLPIFVAALAVASFLNGFWMVSSLSYDNSRPKAFVTDWFILDSQCVQGYFIRAVSLPRFWYYWAHWIDYQVLFSKFSALTHT